MRRSAPLLILVAGLGLALYWVVGAFGLFQSLPLVKQIVADAGLVVAAVALVMLVANFILDVLLTATFQVAPNDLVRAVVIALLAVIATTLLLAFFGVDVLSILTTSAILGAIAAVAMRSSFGGVMAGISLSSLPRFGIGATIEFNGERMTIEKRTMSSIIGRRSDNVRLLVPNSVLVGAMIVMFPEDGPTRFDVFLHLPPDVPPQRITDLLADAFVDIEHLDTTCPVEVAPIETRPDLGSIKYRIRLFARDQEDADRLSGEVLRRAWYVLNRAAIGQPKNKFYETPPWQGPTLAAALAAACPDFTPERREAVLRQGRTYRFAPLEMLRFPDSDAGWAVLILEGRASTRSGHYLNIVGHGREADEHLPAMPVEQLSTSAAVRTIAGLLAAEVGPIAERLVRETINTTRTRADLLAALASFIPVAERRAAFIEAGHDLAGGAGTRGPGTIQMLCRDVLGRQIPEPELRAVSELIAVTFPSEIHPEELIG